MLCHKALADVVVTVQSYITDAISVSDTWNSKFNRICKFQGKYLYTQFQCSVLCTSICCLCICVFLNRVCSNIKQTIGMSYSNFILWKSREIFFILPCRLNLLSNKTRLTNRWHNNMLKRKSKCIVNNKLSLAISIISIWMFF